MQRRVEGQTPLRPHRSDEGDRGAGARRCVVCAETSIPDRATIRKGEFMCGQWPSGVPVPRFVARCFSGSVPASHFEGVIGRNHCAVSATCVPTRETKEAACVQRSLRIS